MKTRDLIFVALFAALSGVGAFLRIPLPFVPFTLQVFFCAMAAILLGARLGMLSQLVYVGMGLVGLPVFVEGGGLAYIFKPTFGYLIGFILGAYVMGRLVERMKGFSVWRLFLALLPGLAVIYLCGLGYMYVIYNLYLGLAKEAIWILYWGFLTCIGGDLLSLYLVSLVGKRMMPLVNRLGMNIKKAT